MKRRMTREEARAWKARWALVNEAEIEELRSTPVSLKMKQLGTLMAWSSALGWEEALAAEDAEVHERWNRLRKAYGV